MNDRSRRLLGAIVLAVAASLALSAGAQANNMSRAETVFGTNVQYAGYGGMRAGDGTGQIVLSGVSGTVTKALLYWHGPTNSTSPTSNSAVMFAGSPVSGQNIGFSSDNCWGFSNSQAYRADVTSKVPGNGTYQLANFIKGDSEINGVSLVVFFNDGDAANNRDVVIFQGNDSNITNPFDADGWNATLSNINYSSGSASLDLSAVSDGQNFDDDALRINGNELAPAGPIFQGDTVPNGPNDNNGGLWDIRSYDLTPFLSPGNNTLALTTGVNSDCLSLVFAGINLPAGTAPVSPTDERMTSNATRTGTKFASIRECSAPLANSKNRPFTVQWNDGTLKTFKLDSAGSTACFNDPDYPARPAGFNRQTGVGTGKINNVGGFQIEWDLVDGGSSASMDRAAIRIIRVSDGTVVREVTFGALTGTGVNALGPTPPAAT